MRAAEAARKKSTALATARSTAAGGTSAIKPHSCCRWNGAFTIDMKRNAACDGIVDLQFPFRVGLLQILRKLGCVTRGAVLEEDFADLRQTFDIGARRL